MSVKLFIGSKSPIDSPQHLYIVRDEDGDPTTTNDQSVIRGGPEIELTTSGKVKIELGVPMGDSMDNFGVGEDHTDRNFTEIDLGAADPDDVWETMLSAAEAMGTVTGDEVVTDIDYELFFGPNSNSVVRTLLYHVGVDLGNQLPRVGGSGDPIPLSTFWGQQGFLGTGQNDVWFLDTSNGPVIVTDAGGDDTYYIDASALGSGAGVITIREVAEEGSNDVFVLTNIDPEDVGVFRTANGDLVITANGKVVGWVPGQYADGSLLESVVIQPSVGSPVTILVDNPNDIPLFTPEAVPGYLPDALDPVTSVPGRSPGGGGAGGGGLDPLVFDLDASGTIDLISLANGVHFDFWGDGFAEKNGWAAPTDGMLAIDLNENGMIDSSAELFGSDFPLTYLVEDNWSQFINEENGFARLAKYDLVANGGNGDGEITSADAVWADLVMWQDANSDGISQSGELLTLSSLGITSIDVSDYELESFNGLASGTPFSRIIEGNTVTHTGTFTMNGVEREVVDVWFDSDLINTVYVGEYTLDPRVLFLPTARGYGMLPDLHVAMSQNEDLLDDVADFVINRSFEDLFDGAATDVEDLMLAWAGLDATDLPDFDYSKHGVFEALKEYWFLRRFTGQDTDFLGTWFDMSPYLPRVDDGMEGMHEAYDNVLNAFSARLIFQSGGSALFEEGVTYNPFTDEFEGTFALSQNAVDDLETAAGTSGDAEAYWRSVALFIENTMGLGELSGTELGWLDDAVDGSTSGALEWADIIATLSVNTIAGTSGADTLTGTRWNDSISGGNGADTLTGGEGDDILTGGDGDDILIGGLGDDILFGGYGNDTYVYDYGHDVIVEQSPSGSTDVIQLAAGITTSDVTVHFARMDAIPMSSHLFLEIAGRGTITIKTLTSSAANTLIDQIQFDGGPTWYMTSTPIHFHGTNGDEIIYSTGFTGNNFVFGYDGDDILNGNSGADTLYGGGGDDDLRGGGGDDIYMVSSGNDVIRETGGTDTILVPDGYTIDDVSFERVEAGGAYTAYDEMRIVVNGLGSITVLDTFLSSSNGKNVETLELAGGTQINLLTKVFTTPGTSGNDTMVGTRTNWGQLDDIYLFSGGTDTVNEAYGGYDILRFGEGVSPGSITLSRTGDNQGKDLLISDGSGNSIKFVNHFTDSASMLGSLEKIEFANGTSWTIASLEIETLGTSGADNVFDYTYGDASTADTIYGFGGNDQLRGGDGDDLIYGGDDNDTLDGDNGNDVLYGENGADTLNGGADDDILYGGSGNDILRGDGGNDFLDGGDGDDSIQGGAGTDTVSYETATSAVTVSLAITSAQNTVGAGTDTIWQVENLNGSAYNDTLTGNSSANTIKGGAGDDTINGGGGNDILYGGAGTDTLTGGANADTFVFELLSAFTNQDTITDFSTAQSDKIDIHDIIDVEFDPLTDAIADFVNFTNSGSDSIMSIDRDGTGTTYSFENVATLLGVTNLDETTLYNNGNLLAA